MKILIIGATGMLARPVIQQFDKKGFNLRLFSRSIHPGMFENRHECLKGDVFDDARLSLAMEGCDAIHISLSNLNEEEATQKIIQRATTKQIKLISMVSGCTVAEENRWFPMIDQKYKSEQLLKTCGIPYLIFKPTWFFESLGLMVRNGKASVPGRQIHPYHWVAAEDFARLVATAYTQESVLNHSIYVYGPQKMVMKEALEKYCTVLHPGIKRVSYTPLSLLNIIARMTGKKQLKQVAELFRYFEQVEEPSAPGGIQCEFIKLETTLERWLAMNQNAHHYVEQE